MEVFVTILHRGIELQQNDMHWVQIHRGIPTPKQINSSLGNKCTVNSTMFRLILSTVPWCHCPVLPTQVLLPQPHAIFHAENCLCLQKKKKLFHIFFFWLCWVVIAVCRLSLLVVSRRYSSFWGAASLCCWAQALGTQPSVIAAGRLGSHGVQFSCSKGCEIFPDQRLNPYSLHWQMDSYPLYHQGSHCSKF